MTFFQEALAIKFDSRANSADVISTLAELVNENTMPAHVRSDCGPKFAAKATF